MRYLALLLLLASGPAAAQDRAPYRVVETGKHYDDLQEAVNAIGDRSGTIEIAPGTYGDCAVQEAGRVAFVAQTPGTVLFRGGVCEDKATLVLRGRGARVEGLSFAGTFVEDGNGAGIRIERGNLVVSETRFADAQGGILSADDPSGTISIDRSTFSGLGKHPDGSGAHSLYVNGYGALRITNSRFERGMGGHYLKSRAPRIEIVGCSFDDSAGRNTNYMVDLSHGAVGRIAGNAFVNGPNKDNYGTIIAVAPEGSNQPSEGLVIEGNKAWLAPTARYRTSFIGSWTGEKLVIRNNELAAGVGNVERH